MCTGPGQCSAATSGSSVVPHQWWPVRGRRVCRVRVTVCVCCRRRGSGPTSRVMHRVRRPGGAELTCRAHVTVMRCRGSPSGSPNELSFSVAYACGHFALLFIRDMSIRITISVAEFNNESTEITLS